jgi:predicted hydrolase (HD superfamily)
VRKRFKEKAFARGADREIIAECEQAGIPLAEFCELSLIAMQTIAEEINL